MYTKKELDRFWKSVDKNGPVVKPELGRCWLWLQSISIDPDGGYGNFRLRKKKVKAHRFSWELANGRKPRLQICHKCDIRHCVNPKHLFEATQRQNCEDMMAKGRCIRAKGEKHSQAKLTNEIVISIRLEHAQGAIGRHLAPKYGISTATMYKILNRQAWTHI